MVPAAHPPPLTLTSPPCSPGDRQVPPFTAYWRAGISNCVGPACGLQALKYISYPAQARAGRAAPAMPCA